MTNIDFAILNFIQEYMRTSFGDVFMKLITAIGDHGISYIAFSLIMLCIPKMRSLGVRLAVTMASGFVICNLLLKKTIARIRPYEVANFDIIVAPLSDFSFPSGHTFFAFACSAVVFSRYKKWGIAMYILSAIIGFSRLYLYVHYPSDVVAGAVLGWLTGYVVVKIFDKRQKKI